MKPVSFWFLKIISQNLTFMFMDVAYLIYSCNIYSAFDKKNFGFFILTKISRLNCHFPAGDERKIKETFISHAHWPVVLKILVWPFHKLSLQSSERLSLRTFLVLQLVTECLIKSRKNPLPMQLYRILAIGICAHLCNLLHFFYSSESSNLLQGPTNDSKSIAVGN